MQAARTSKRGSREAEAALLSLDALHKQVPAAAVAQLIVSAIRALLAHVDSCLYSTSHTLLSGMDICGSTACLLQIKPFVLRRTKDQVLSDLPPKVIQDVYVEPSPLQA